MIKKRRGISEIFATLMLLGITTAGSVMLASLVGGSGLNSSAQNSQVSHFPAYSIKLIGYDTRDSTDLYGINTLDNAFNSRLCTGGCLATPDNIPTSSGTEFVVLHLKNTGPTHVYLEGVQINNIIHTWDANTGARVLDASLNDMSGKYPLNGKFSILSGSGLVQKSDNKLVEDEEVRLVVKLSKDLATDLLMTKPISIGVDFGGPRMSDHVILSGEIR